MANTLTETGRAAFLTGTANWSTGLSTTGSIMACLITTTATTTGIKLISGTTPGATTSITATAHGFTTGDLVSISGVGGTLAANGIWQITSTGANAFTIQDPVTGLAVVSTGETWTSGGYALNLGPSAAGSTWGSFSAALIGSGTALTSLTETGLGSGGAGATAWTETDGTANAAGVTFTAVSGAVVSGVMLVATTNVGALTGTPVPLAWIDGQMIVTCAAPLAAGTTLYVERLPATIPNATVLSFSDGTTATLTASPLQYARTVTVSSTTVAMTARAQAPALGSGLPVTPNGGNISITWDPNGYKIFKL